MWWTSARSHYVTSMCSFDLELGALRPNHRDSAFKDTEGVWSDGQTIPWKDRLLCLWLYLTLSDNPLAFWLQSCVSYRLVGLRVAFSRSFFSHSEKILVFSRSIICVVTLQGIEIGAPSISLCCTESERRRKACACEDSKCVYRYR